MLTNAARCADARPMCVGEAPDVPARLEMRDQIEQAGESERTTRTWPGRAVTGFTASPSIVSIH